MRTILLLLSIVLVAFQQPKKKTIDRVYFGQNSSDILAISPVDKKTKSEDVLKNFVEMAKSGTGIIKLRCCVNYDEVNLNPLTDKRLDNVRDELLKLGAPVGSIDTEYFNKNKSVDLSAKPQSAIDTIKQESKKEFFKAHNRFVELKFLKRS